MQVVYDVGSWRLTEDGRIYRRGKLRFANGDLYDGEWVDGKREGRGKFTYQNGSYYLGDMMANMFHGFGMLVIADIKHPLTNEWIKGSTYEGHFQHGKKHGKGLIVYGEGGTYDGSFEDNVFCGHGIRCYKNGDRYEGSWRHGEWWGQGELCRLDGEKYTGEFKRGMFHNFGHHIFSNNSGSYEGDFRNGEKHGQGLRIFADGSKYEGQWVDNVMHGNGVWITSDFTYIGEFESGWPHGHGLYSFKNGDVYEGSVQQGYFYGRGKYTFKDGSWYDGDYVATKQIPRKSKPDILPTPNGKKHGQGIRKWSNGNTYEGSWQDDLMHGHGILKSTLLTKTYSLRMEYEGNFERGFQTGQGSLRVWNTEGIRMEFPVGSGNWYSGKGTCTYTGNFLRGYFHGQGLLVTCDGRRYDGEWQQGKRSGYGKSDLIPLAECGDEARMFIKGSNALYRFCRYEGIHTNDKRHGYGVAYYCNGDHIEGEFNHGQIDGVATYIYASGERRRGLWKMGKRLSWLSDDEDAARGLIEKCFRNKAPMLFSPEETSI